MIATGNNDAVTTEEIIAYWKRGGWQAAEKLGFNMVADIKAHREPEYVNEAVYVDACGTFWQFFKANPEEGWTEPVWNAFGDMYEHAFDVPRRPLTRLVPGE